jgi:hypothetical protein
MLIIITITYATTEVTHYTLFHANGAVMSSIVVNMPTPIVVTMPKSMVMRTCNTLVHKMCNTILVNMTNTVVGKACSTINIEPYALPTLH